MKQTILNAILIGSAAWVYAAGDITLNGSFVRGAKSGAPHDLKATLTPNGADDYKITWEAEWKGKLTLYTGQIKGDIKNGDFTGTATDKSGKRTWKVEGKAANGVLTFDHFETTGGREGKTGTGTLQ